MAKAIDTQYIERAAASSQRTAIATRVAAAMYNGFNFKGVSDDVLKYTVQKINETAVMAADNLIRQLNGDGGNELVEQRRIEQAERITHKQRMKAINENQNAENDIGRD